MSNEITMPKLSDTMEEGKILHWLKRPGDQIRKGDALAEVETDKADMVMESFDDGVLEEILLKEGDSAPVGAVIAKMRVEAGTEVAAGEATASALASEASQGASADAEATGGAIAAPSAPAAKRSKPNRARERATGSGTKAPASGNGGSEMAAAASDGGERAAPAVSLADESEIHPAMSANPSAAPTAMPKPPPLSAVQVEPITYQREGPVDRSKLRASPLARRAAEGAGIDLGSVRGTGPDGRVTKRDVDNFLREQQLFKFRRLVSPREGAPGTHEELSKMRRTIANRMAQSKREIPHFYATTEVDMEECVRLKSSLEATEIFDEDISFNDIIIKATALALARYSRMNASFENDGITIRPNINIGVAVAVEEGLIVPVIHDCETKTLPEVARAAHKLIAKAARGGFTSDELSGATFSISNMGMLGVEHFAAVIIPPQAAILAVSAIKERPVVRNGALAVGKTMMITVSCDHRIIDGVVAARFLQELKRFLENPASLLVV